MHDGRKVGTPGAISDPCTFAVSGGEGEGVLRTEGAWGQYATSDAFTKFVDLESALPPNFQMIISSVQNIIK